jgi:two-component system, NtrC family, sensor kinase
MSAMSTERPSPLPRSLPPWARAEGLAAAWEVFSSLLFTSAVVPAGFETPAPALIFGGSLALSAALASRLALHGTRGRVIAAALRALSWLAMVAPLLAPMGARVLVAALAFGLMAGGLRSFLYRRTLDGDPSAQGDTALARGLRTRLSEGAMVAGVVGGHVMLLFGAAFLRAQSDVLLRGFIETVPALALVGTAGFTLAVWPATRGLLRAIEAGPDGPREVLLRGLREGLALPQLLAGLNFVVWFGCMVVGLMRLRLGLVPRRFGDLATQIALGALFAWGVSFYQRAWHREAVAPAVERLRRWAGAPASAEPTALRRRMLWDFGAPLLFMAALLLLSSIGLYRALDPAAMPRADLRVIGALVAAFAILIIVVGGVVARAARELSVPMAQLARAADQVARGQLDAKVPRVAGPVEVVMLGESVERMRQALSRTIGELSAERAGLEANVEARTAELRRALAELRSTQAALIQGERLATIGELVAGLAHEIYNPLTAIAGAATPMGDLVASVREALTAYREAEAELSPERRGALEALRREVDLDASLEDLLGIAVVIRRATERSVRIVQNLRNFSRISGEPVPTDLRLGLEETLMLVGPRLREAGIRIERRFEEVPEVMCQAGEVNQVFMNLLVNAIQALEQGAAEDRVSGRGGAGDRVITLAVRCVGAAVAVSVADNGPGVPAEIVARIFDPFFTTKPRGQGTGLGLSISSDIARRHGGSLSLEPLDGAGSMGACFVCKLPIGAPRVV